MTGILHYRRLIGGILLGMLFLSCASMKTLQPEHQLESYESRNISVDSSLNRDPVMNALIEPYREDMEAQMNVVIGYAAMDLIKGKPEAPLNNFVADLMLQKAREEHDKPVAVALTNLGGLRVEIPEGPITRGKIYEVMPFENELVVIELTGVQLITLAKEIGEIGGEAIAGMKIEYVGDRLSKFAVQGKIVEGDSLYGLVTTDYLSSPGRNRFSILSSGPRTFLGITLRDAILQKIEKLHADGEKVSVEIDGRMIVREKP
ncbi:MAG: 5'-nucleotidase C-terminal domain-containing protein [Calditrichaeota bacterium]|nr:5'-nucleotidase C-terminal domain-containing protein [Calditrichota bacterium]